MQNKPTDSTCFDEYKNAGFMDGFTAAKLIKEIRPDLPIVAQTACALDPEIKNFDGFLKIIRSNP